MQATTTNVPMIKYRLQKCRNTK